MFVIYTDTDMEVTPEIAKKYGFKLISMPYSFNDEMTRPYEDFDIFDESEFYNRLRAGELPSTSSVNAEEYKNYFEEDFKAGNEILYLHFSSAMSGTFQSMKIAVEELEAQYPQAKFHAIDTRAISILALNVAMEVGEMYLAGKTYEEILAWTNTELDHYAMYFYTDNLKFFARSGRVTGLAAFIGNIIGIHPILTMTADGKLTPCTKVRGSNKALSTIVDYVEKLGDDIKNYRILIAEADCHQIADKLIKMLKERFGEDLEVIIVPVNPTVGVHCGPDCVGVSFHSKQR